MPLLAGRMLTVFPASCLRWPRSRPVQIGKRSPFAVTLIMFFSKMVHEAAGNATTALSHCSFRSARDGIP